MYSTLVSDFVTNSETIVQHLNNLPHHEVAAEMAKQADTINQRFSMLNNQFSTYQEDMTNYLQWLHDHMNDRKDQRTKGNPENKGNRE
jgi:hypothetical protein